MKTRPITRCVLLIACTALISCATIMHGTMQDVSVNSTPVGAKVTVDGVVMGTTPLIVNLKRKDKHAVAIEVDGYEPYAQILTRKTAGWVWGNIIFGGLPGLAVDAISGGLYKIEPDSLMVDFYTEAEGIGKDGTLYLTTVLEPDTQWQKVGQLEPSR